MRWAGRVGATQAKTPMSWLRMIAVVLLVAGIPAPRGGPARAGGGRPRRRGTSLPPVAGGAFNGAQAAGEAPLAVGLRSARRTAGKAAIAAHAALLTSALAARSAILCGRWSTRA